MEQQDPFVPNEPPASSFLERAANVFASPGELFAELSTLRPQTTSWLIPYIFAMVLAVLATITVATNPALKDQALQPQREEIQKKVESGQMTQEQADKFNEQMDSVSPVMFVAFGGVSAIVILSVAFFGIVLALWLVARYGLKFTGSYKKILELYGLAMTIGILGGVVGLLMMSLMNSMQATPGGGLLLLGSFDRHNFGHNFLASMNVFTIWQTAIVGMGLAKVSNKSAGAGMAVSFGLWLVWVVISSALGWGGR